MRLLDVGHGARELLGASRHGVVHSVFARAVYLALSTSRGPALVALTTPGAPPGPIHLRAAAIGPHHTGQVALVAAEQLLVGGTAYDLRAPDWHPDELDPSQLDAGRPLLLTVTRDLPVPELALSNRWRPTDLAHAVGRGDLISARDLVSGRGPGLTPAGDDVLAGLLVFAAIRWGAAGRPQLSTASDGSVTGVIPAAFLHWAGRGSTIEPAHRLLAAAATGDELGARRAVRELAVVGSSSGLDLAFGLRLAAEWLPPADQDVAGEWTHSSLAALRPGLDQDSGRLART